MKSTDSQVTIKKDLELVLHKETKFNAFNPEILLLDNNIDLNVNQILSILHAKLNSLLWESGDIFGK